MLTYLTEEEPPEDGPPSPPAGARQPLRPGWCSATDRAWWNFERPPAHDPTHPAAGWVGSLLQEVAGHRLACPRCGREGTVKANLDHLLRHHGADFGEAAAWLEAADADLFSLAIHYLATKARAGRSLPG